MSVDFLNCCKRRGDQHKVHSSYLSSLGINTAYLARENESCLSFLVLEFVQPWLSFFQPIFEFLEPQRMGKVSCAHNLNALDSRPLIQIGQIYCLRRDRKSTRLNSSHSSISYAVF